MDDIYWNVQAMCHKSSELLKRMCVNARYLI